MSKQASKRLQKEYQSLNRSPPPFCVARPYESNLLECHFIMRGPKDSPYAGGEYHGVLIFTPQYPFAPPGIKVFTPSGRFRPDTKLCTSFSDFHAGSWNPSWSISTILTGLLSFMLSDEITTGSTRTTEEEKKHYAQVSHAHNLKNPKFKTVFPEYATPQLKELPNMGQADLGVAAKNQPPLPQPLGNPDIATDPNAVASLTAEMQSTSLCNGTIGPNTLANAAHTNRSRSTLYGSIAVLVVAALCIRIYHG